MRLCDFVHDLGPVVGSADALLFHRLGPHTWTEFIRKYMPADVQSPSPQQVLTAMRILRKRNLPLDRE
ncbi:protein of unknown function [Burkholderia multivorans]